MAETVKVALIGSGGMAKAHIPGLSAMDDVEIVGFCDVVKERAEAMVAEHGGAAFDDPGVMLDTTKADCAYVLLPPFVHGAAEDACLKRDVPFFVEKPLNNNWEQACGIAAQVEAKGLLTQVGYMNRYREGLNAAKAILADDPAIFVSGGWIGGTPKPNPDRPISMWWVQKAKSGGQFVEQVTHTVDLVRYLCGDATEVMAYAANGFNQDIPGYDIDDAMTVAIKLERGGVCNLVSCCASNAKGGVWLDIYAGQSAFSFTGWDHSGKIQKAGEKAAEVKGEPDIFVVEDKAFIAAVKTGDQSLSRCSYPDGLKTLEISIAANLSAAKGEPVSLPLPR